MAGRGGYDEDWIKRRSSDIVPPTAEALLGVLGVSRTSAEEQRRALAYFMTLPAGKPIPPELRAELVSHGLLEAPTDRSETQSTMDQNLRHLVDRAWQDFERMKGLHVLEAAIPILLFGDLTAYMRSDLRIVTVGLNPSSAEFPLDDPLSRFPSARQLAMGVVTDTDADMYIRSLSDYFRERPYARWFSRAFGSVLEGAGATFRDGNRVALHTDICSPLATNPTWSKLAPDMRAALLHRGVPLWRELIEYLQPDMAIVSVARLYTDLIGFDGDQSWRPVYRVPRTNPYEVIISRRTLRSGKTCVFAFGRAAQLPFGTVCADDQRRIGSALMEAVCA
jgi:hypothetical protein